MIFLFLFSCKQPLDTFSDLYVPCMHYGTYNIIMKNFSDNMDRYTCRNLAFACNEFSNLKWMYSDQDRLFIELRAWVE